MAIVGTQTFESQTPPPPPPHTSSNVSLPHLFATVQDAYHWSVVFYWGMLILLGSFFISNLLIVLINESFTVSRAEAKKSTKSQLSRSLHFGKPLDKQNTSGPTYEVRHMVRVCQILIHDLICCLDLQQL